MVGKLSSILIRRSKREKMSSYNSNGIKIHQAYLPVIIGESDEVSHLKKKRNISTKQKLTRNW